MIQTETNDVSNPTGQHWLIWDGECGFCRECINWVQKHDTLKKFIPITFQTAPSPPMTRGLLEQSRQAVQVVTSEGQIISAGAACAFLLHEIGYKKLGRVMRLWGVRTVVEWGYNLVANKRDFFGRFVFGKTCAKDSRT
jgi:predicted DCC family thiol-disulfide oxidoreductase YuxK